MLCRIHSQALILCPSEMAFFQVLCTLNRKTSDVKLMLKPVLQYMSSGFHGNRGVRISRLSEPLLWLILRVLDCETMIRHCLNMGYVQALP